MENCVLYKYRATSRLENTLDIIINQRMYAAKFEELNDPMEGWYIYNPDTFSQSRRRVIFKNKARYGLLCLSEAYDNILMWSHYAENNCGIVVGVSVTDPDADVKQIEYVSDLSHIDMARKDIPEVAKSILTKKLKMWQYERERRAFISGRSFIAVEVRELIFGFNIDKGLEKLLLKVSEKFCPNVTPRKLNRNELDRGNKSFV